MTEEVLCNRLIDARVKPGREELSIARKSRITREWLKRTKLIASPFVLILLVPGLFPSEAAQNDSLSPRLEEYLKNEIGLTRLEMQSVIAGRPVAKSMKTKKNEVAIFGIIRIYGLPEFFIEKYMDIVAFESGSGVQSMARFHSPPVLSDVSDLQLDNKELKELRKCKPGDCPIKLSGRAMQSFRQEIDWSSPTATIQAQAVFRQAFVDYVANYQKIGDEALAVYSDQDKPQPIRDGLRQLLQNSSHFIEYDAGLANYLEKYPQERPPETEDIFYWQKGAFGLKPVVRASHSVIHRNQHETNVSYTIVSKMLFASHYFRSALELKGIVPDSESAESKSFYLVCMNRSFIDGLTGIRGALIRGNVLEKSRKSLDRYMASVKQKIEGGFRENVK